MKRVSNGYDYIQHPGNLPIYCRQAANDDSHRQANADICVKCGLRFKSRKCYASGTALDVDIPLPEQDVHIQGHVISSQRQSNTYEISLIFDSEDDAFMARMAEQLCHIEAYRRRVHADQGRHLSVDSAAEEWIDQYACSFPSGPQ